MKKEKNTKKIIEYFQSNNITQTKFKFIYFELLIKYDDANIIQNYDKTIIEIYNQLNTFDIFNKDYIEYLQIYLEYTDKFTDKPFNINELLKKIITYIDSYKLNQYYKF